ncbi:serine/threonine protein kinase [Lineolata rhizophorae]|uniref:Serine/threonine protein kinase n=1 Tax=Lineolata rhizophorae TaxID=578093 RepID=A0A6A6NLC4_9PEZI|nr:serine/threonine protein kinase [Lineolata rhizophorae]
MLKIRYSSRADFISLGAVGAVYKINDRIALKIPREADRNKFAIEIATYDTLERHRPPCPDIAQSFLRTPDANFLAFYSHGTLDKRIRSHQVRSNEVLGGRLLQVTELEPLNLVHQWAMELSSGAAWLESLGLAHADLRPPNLLLDGQDHLKIADFDCVEAIGTLASGGAPPWARFCGPEGGDESGTFGKNGARVEQFSIGSILYFMSRGYEPYDDGAMWPRGPEIVDLMMDMQFPPIGEMDVDMTIQRCWRGEYLMLKDLANDTKLLHGAFSLPRAASFDDQYCKHAREECRKLVESGLLRSFDRTF